MLGIPHRLDAVGVTEAHVDSLAEAAVADPSASTNPIPFRAADYAAIFRAGLAGDV